MIEYPLLDDFDVIIIIFCFSKIFFWGGGGGWKKKNIKANFVYQTYYLNSYENYNLPPIAYN